MAEREEHDRPPRDEPREDWSAPDSAAAPAEAPRLTDPVEAGDKPPQQPARGWAPPRRGLRMTIAMAVLAVIGALLALYAWDLPPFGATRQTTDNAYVRGSTTVISPQVNGYVREVLVQDFQRVAAGQVLVRIDDRIYRQRVEQAEANLSAQAASVANWEQSRRSSAASVRGQSAAVASARAQLVRAQADMARVEDLAADRSVSLRERDQTLATLRQAEAAVRQAEAQEAVAREQTRTVEVNRGSLEAGLENARAALRLAQIDLENTIVRAPRDGAIGELGVRVGQLVTAGTQLLFLVPTNVWVVANFKEAQTARIAPGQPATVRVDALGGRRLRGTVERLAPAAGNEFAVIRPDNATGNFVKVPQRIGVRIALEPGQAGLDRLRPGMSVEAEVDTATQPAATAAR
jgi:multidrug resistance efflux pump